MGVNGVDSNKYKISYVATDNFSEVASHLADGGDAFTIVYVNDGRVLYPDDVDRNIIVEVNSLDHRQVSPLTIGGDPAERIKAIHRAMDRVPPVDVQASRPVYSPPRRRVRKFLAGHVRSSRVIGSVLDVAENFLPSWVGDTRTELKQWIKPDTTMPERVKPWLTQKSTWEGVAALAGAVGLVIYPEAIVEIVTGVLLVIGGIEAWKRESDTVEA